jgi:hypothetical protein
MVFFSFCFPCLDHTGGSNAAFPPVPSLPGSVWASCNYLVPGTERAAIMLSDTAEVMGRPKRAEDRESEAKRIWRSCEVGTGSPVFPLNTLRGRESRRCFPRLDTLSSGPAVDCEELGCDERRAGCLGDCWLLQTQQHQMHKREL